MPKFAVNLSMLFTELPLIERFAAARQAGFDCVEIQFPYELSIDQIREALDANNQTLILINLPAGDWAGGERGIACLPDRIEEFDKGVALALEYATALGVSRINCLSGIQPASVSSSAAHTTLVRNLRYAASALAAREIQLVAEPINTRDIPGFYLNKSQQLIDIINIDNVDNLQLQYDVYHMQIMEGNLINTLEASLPHLGHMQIADVPGRHEPGSGEINFVNLFKAVDAMGYSGYISLEYIPQTDTLSGLAQVKQLLNG